MRRVSTAVIAALVPCSIVLADEAEDSTDLGEVVVTAPMMSDPLTVETDPKAPRQPVPASDGASYLKNIPGFAVSRKGGIDGDPALRGLGGSRLNVLLDDAYILGGCGGRMDPPTAYVFPESYDKITVLKGPENVLYGANVAGAVLFERNTPRFTAPGVRGTGSLLFGSFDRNDQLFDVAAGASQGYVRMIGTRSDANNYEDGDGNEIHSFYTRRSGTAIAGWTPDANTRVELSYDVSDSEAAYADRMMDGVAFDREGYSIGIEKTNLSDLVEKVEFKAYHNYIDHVMDNYSLRPLVPTPTNPTARRMVNNPDRTTEGARLAVQLGLGAATFATVGADYQENQHSLRQGGVNYQDLPRRDKASFENTGLFGEIEHAVTARDRAIAGVRLDESEANAELATGYGGAAAGTTDEESNRSAFVRYEHDLAAAPVTLYAGLGRAERSPDFWERDRLFTLETEKNNQLDLGMTYRSGRIQASLALFYADISDFILLTGNGASAKNIDATTMGGEADFAYALSERWKVIATLAYVHGDNDTDDKPLAQMPPLEGRIGLNYDDRTWSAGVLFRAVDRQDRVDVGSGTIFGTDIGETAGFGVLSLNGGYRPGKNLLLTAGIDNVLDRTYAEHLGRGSADLGAVTGRVNEPGRTLWVKAVGSF